KILVDLLASSNPPARVKEVPYTFRQRVRGESKLDILVGIEYLQLLLDKAIGDFIPPSFILYSLVGSAGAALHIGLLWIQFHLFHESFLRAQIVATILAMTANFLLNNVITYRSQRLRGWRLIEGLIVFYLACSVGLLINVKLAEFVRDAGVNSYLAGLFGLAVGSVWNYVVTRIFTWRTYRKANRNRRENALAARVRTAP